MTSSDNRATRRTPTDAARSRIEKADTGPRGNLAAKLAMIENYILNQAVAGYSGKVSNVPCPDRARWAELARGRGAVLPNESQLALYANDGMRTVAKRLGSLREAYFAVASHRLLKRQVQRTT